jgi:hypothetical protein
MIRYDNWLRTQTANNAQIPGGMTGGAGTTTTGTNTTTGGTNTTVTGGGGGGTTTTTTTIDPRAAELFNLYVTGQTPDQGALSYWTGRINAVGYENAKREFLNPTDYTSPRVKTMFGDPDYLSASNGGPAGNLFRLYATDYTYDQDAINFWNNKIATMGYDAAVNEFLNPQDPNAPRNKIMFLDPDYIARMGNRQQPPPPITPPTVTPGGAQTPITNANLTNVLPGGAVEAQIASGALPQRVIIGGAPITLGGGMSAYPYGTQANADILGLPAQRLQEVAAAGQMPPGLVAQPVTPAGGIGALPNPFTTITTPTVPFTAPANYNPYANVNYGNPFFINADTVNPYGSLAANTAGMNVTNPTATPAGGSVTNTVAPGGVPGTTFLNPTGTDTVTGAAGNDESDINIRQPG